MMNSFNCHKIFIYYALVIFISLCTVLENDAINHLALKPDYTLWNFRIKRELLLKQTFCKPIISKYKNGTEIKDHRSIKTDGKYINPWKTWKTNSFIDFAKWRINENDNSNVPSQEKLDYTLPIIPPEFSKTPPNDRIEVTWIGHSTLVVRFDNISIITDPMFSDRASFSQYIGPKRYRRAACTVDQLPHIDAVVISHNHYDHLDLNSVKALNERFGANLYWFVPMEMGQWMRDEGITNVMEMEWWSESCIIDKSHIKFAFTPTQHWSKRSLTDTNDVLWGSWAIIGPNHRFFFTGDTGYCAVFKEIGEIYGPFCLAAIPIGAYEPKWFMRYAHIDPEDAVKIHEDIQSQKSIAIHWGTFSLSYEHYLEPKEKLQESVIEHKLPLESFTTLLHGHTNLL